MSDTKFKKDDIIEAYVVTGSSGDTASGWIRLTYENEEIEEKRYEIPYDTVTGPNGLETIVSVGEEVRDPKTEQSLPITKFVHNQASDTLSHYYSAVKQGGKERDNLVFTSHKGSEDGWLPK